MNKYKFFKGLYSVVGALLVLLISHALATQAASTRTAIESRQVTNPDLLSPGYSQIVPSGGIVTFTHVLTNVSAITDSFALTATSSQGWPVELHGPTGVLSQPLQLEAGFTTTVLLQIAVLSGVLSGTVDTAIITATSQTTPTLTSESVDTTVVQNPTWYTYLPLVLRPLPPPTGINGQVTYQGNLMSGIQVVLNHCYNMGIYWACPVTESRSTSTRLDGFYEFTMAPSLNANEKYLVRFYNYASGSDPKYVAAWSSISIYAYTAGQTVSGGNFDIANVPLLSPADAITVGLPLVFQWTPRATSPSDSYQIEIWNAADESIHWASPQLGHVGSYTLTSLPANFTFGTQYAWQVVIYANGGSGVSHETRLITFSGARGK